MTISPNLKCYGFWRRAPHEFLGWTDLLLPAFSTGCFLDNRRGRRRLGKALVHFNEGIYEFALQKYLVRFEDRLLQGAWMPPFTARRTIDEVEDEALWLELGGEGK